MASDEVGVKAGEEERLNLAEVVVRSGRVALLVLVKDNSSKAGRHTATCRGCRPSSAYWEGKSKAVFPTANAARPSGMPCQCVTGDEPVKFRSRVPHELGGHEGIADRPA